jgi:alpha-beta hydrolase superfamily lysophospholipase
MTDVTLPTPDGLELAGLALSPAQPPRAAVAMVHGLGEHVHRYDALHRALLAAGFAATSTAGTTTAPTRARSSASRSRSRAGARCSCSGTAWAG